MSELPGKLEQFNKQRTEGFLDLLETGGFVINGEFFQFKKDYAPELIPEVYRGDFIRTIHNNPTTPNTPGLSFARELITDTHEYDEVLAKGGFTKFYMIPPNLLNNIQVINENRKRGTSKFIGYKNAEDIPKGAEQLIEVVLDSICNTINNRFDESKDDKKLSIFDLRKAIINKIENDNFKS